MRNFHSPYRHFSGSLLHLCVARKALSWLAMSQERRSQILSIHDHQPEGFRWLTLKRIKVSAKASESVSVCCTYSKALLANIIDSPPLLGCSIETQLAGQQVPYRQGFDWVPWCLHAINRNSDDSPKVVLHRCAERGSGSPQRGFPGMVLWTV